MTALQLYISKRKEEQKWCEYYKERQRIYFPTKLGLAMLRLVCSGLDYNRGDIISAVSPTCMSHLEADNDRQDYQLLTAPRAHKDQRVRLEIHASVANIWLQSYDFHIIMQLVVKVITWPATEHRLKTHGGAAQDQRLEYYDNSNPTVIPQVARRFFISIYTFLPQVCHDGYPGAAMAEVHPNKTGQEFGTFAGPASIRDLIGRKSGPNSQS
ncbi:hypothetical protein T265_15669, partial [Opisthorchis viverrini]